MASQKTIVCTQCNEEKGTTKVRYDDLEKRGVLKTYVCRSCKSANPIYKAPSSQPKITCSCCGKQVASPKPRYIRLVAEGKIGTYLCRECKPSKAVVKAPKKTKKVADESFEPIKPTTLSPTLQNWVPAEPRAPMAKEEFAQINTCFRPDIFLGNKKDNGGEGACNGCAMYEYCGCLTKVWSKKLEKKQKKVA